MPTSVAAALPKTCSSMPIQLEKGTPMPSGGFLLRYVGCFGGPERVDRSKIEIGLAFVSRGLGGVSQCPQGAARLDLEAEPAGSRLAQFLSRRYSNRLWRLRRFLSCGFGLGQRPGRACFVGGHRRRLDCAYSRRRRSKPSWAPWKRGLAALGIAMIGASALILALAPTFVLVFAAEILHGLSGQESSHPRLPQSALVSPAGARCRQGLGATALSMPPEMQ